MLYSTEHRSFLRRPKETGRSQECLLSFGGSRGSGKRYTYLTEFKHAKLHMVWCLSAFLKSPLPSSLIPISCHPYTLTNHFSFLSPSQTGKNLLLWATCSTPCLAGSSPGHHTASFSPSFSVESNTASSERPSLCI